VIVFPASRAVRAARTRAVYTARPDTTGRYRISYVIPGEYLVAVADDLEPNSWFDPRVQETLVPSAVRVTVAASEARVQDLKIR
jgi:hypothetical protein